MNKFLITTLIAVIFVSNVFAHEENLMVQEIRPSADETHHIEVKPQSSEGYRIPYMEVTVTIIDQETQEKKTLELHPMFGGNFHYGANVALKPKQYLLRFHLDAPTFVRTHAREDQWTEPVEAEFPFDASVQFEKSIKIGTKETADMNITFEAEHAEEMFVLEGTEEQHAPTGHQGVQVPESSSAPIFYAAFLVVGVVLGVGISKFMRGSKKK